MAHDGRLHEEDGALSNELFIRGEAPAAGVEVIVAETAVQVDESIHVLPRRGTPEITNAELNTSRVRPSFIEIQLYYPGGGSGASGVPRSSTRTALRFPVPREALPDAERVVAYYASGRSARPDFFHGPGDGTDPEDLSRCYACGYETHKLVSHCPRCGAGMQSRRWSRRFGTVLVACGLFITGLMATVIYFTAPTMLRPGVEIEGTRFEGSRAQGVFFLALMGVVLAFGVTAMLYGAWQTKTGRRSRWVVYVLVGVVVLLTLIALALSPG